MVRTLTKRIAVVSVTCLLAILLSSCANEGASRAAQEWFEAMRERRGADMLALTCQTRKDEAKWLGAGALLMQLGIGFVQMLGVEVQLDTSELQFSASSLPFSNEAEVRVQGVVRVSVAGLAEESEVNEVWRMVRENDQWKWCGRLQN